MNGNFIKKSDTVSYSIIKFFKVLIAAFAMSTILELSASGYTFFKKNYNLIRMTTITEDNLFHSTCFYLYLYLNTKQVCDYVSIFFKSRFPKLEIKKIQ